MEDLKKAETLFWLIPDDLGWRALLFNHDTFDSHAILWKARVAEVIAKAAGRTATPAFKELYDAYPRGRILKADAWTIGYGGDLPSGWTEEKLQSALGVKGTIRTSEHWKANPAHRKLADEFLGR
jgi:hypothetical protein